MADTAALAGLGAALQTFGGAWSAKAQKELADKLEQEREARAEERQIAREARQEAREDARVATTDFINRDGALFKRTFNAKGQQLGESLASQDEIEKRNRDQVKFDQEQQIRDLSIEKGIFERDTRQELYDLEKQKARAGIQTELAQGGMYGAQAGYYNTRDRGGSRGSAGSSGLEASMSEPSMSEVGKAFLEENPEIVKNSGIPYEELLMIASASMREAKKQGKDPLSTLANAVSYYKKRNTTAED